MQVEEENKEEQPVSDTYREVMVIKKCKRAQREISSEPSSFHVASPVSSATVTLSDQLAASPLLNQDHLLPPEEVENQLNLNFTEPEHEELLSP
jgi:hypothetical protein